jgi:transposase
MVLVNKLLLHQPLYRQRKTYAREGIKIDVSTLADRVGACVVAVAPIIEAIRTHVMSAERIHADDTTVPVLTKTACTSLSRFGHDQTGASASWLL